MDIHIFGGKMVIEDNIDTAYINYKEFITKNGDLITDERGDKLYQIPYYNIQFHNQFIESGNVQSIAIPRNTEFNYDGLRYYCNQLLNPYKGDFIYTYGNRLRSYFNVDQLETMIKHLKSNKSSRRAIASTIDPLKDNIESDIPCLQHIQIAIYDNKLIMYVLFRSNDIRYAFVPNMFGLFELHLHLARKIGINAGDFYYTCYNPHWKLK